MGPLWTVPKIAEELGVSPKTVLNWRYRFSADFPAPAGHVGRSLVFDAKEVLDWFTATASAHRGRPQQLRIGRT